MKLVTDEVTGVLGGYLKDRPLLEQKYQKLQPQKVVDDIKAAVSKRLLP